MNGGFQHDEFMQVVEALSKEYGVSRAKPGRLTFGEAALQVDNKVFLMASSQGQVVFKLPKARIEALEATGVGRRFTPNAGRRPTQEWLSVRPESATQCLELGREALLYVRSLD